MKIGILTFHWAKNYGAVLQAYALLSKLKQLGHDPVIINRVPAKRWVNKVYDAVTNRFTWGWGEFDRFSEQYLQPKTLLCDSDEALKAEIKRVAPDAIIVGSDQVWRWKMIGLNYFLDFIESADIRKFSYAASFGLSQWQDSESNTAEIRKLLQAFNKISVRESSGVDICNKVFGVKAQLVVDPTLLHNRDFYERTLLKDLPYMPSKKVVSCILGEETPLRLPQIQQWAKQKHLPHMEIYWSKIDRPVLLKSGESFVKHLGVAAWLNEIRCAEYVITNSFHAAVFCILFGKKFIVLDNPSGGSDRIVTLLNAVGQSSRFCRNIPDDIPDNMDYESTMCLLEAKRTESLKFLRDLE